MTDAAFDVLDGDAFRERLRGGGRVVALFWANWCGYSRMFMPTFDAFARTANVPAVAVDVSHDDDPWWDEARVEFVPTVVAYEDGREAARLDGIPGAGLPPAAFERWVNEHYPGEVGA